MNKAEIVCLAVSILALLAFIILTATVIYEHKFEEKYWRKKTKKTEQKIKKQRGRKNGSKKVQK